MNKILTAILCIVVFSTLVIAKTTINGTSITTDELKVNSISKNTSSSILINNELIQNQNDYFVKSKNGESFIQILNFTGGFIVQNFSKNTISAIEFNADIPLTKIISRDSNINNLYMYPIYTFFMLDDNEIVNISSNSVNFSVPINASRYDNINSSIDKNYQNMTNKPQFHVNYTNLYPSLRLGSIKYYNNKSYPIYLNIRNGADGAVNNILYINDNNTILAQNYDPNNIQVINFAVFIPSGENYTLILNGINPTIYDWYEWDYY